MACIKKIGCFCAVFLLDHCHLCSLCADDVNCLVMSLSSVMLAARHKSSSRKVQTSDAAEQLLTLNFVIE